MIQKPCINELLDHPEANEAALTFGCLKPQAMLNSPSALAHVFTSFGSPSALVHIRNTNEGLVALVHVCKRNRYGLTIAEAAFSECQSYNLWNLKHITQCITVSVTAPEAHQTEA